MTSKHPDDPEPLPPLYKVLSDGLPPVARNLVYSLPKGRTPGDWHEVDGPLVRCRNGLHLTDNPGRYHGKGDEVYLAEIEGEYLPLSGNELVARKVRLLKRVKLVDTLSDGEKEERRQQRAAEAKRKEAERKRKLREDSPAYNLLSLVWAGRGAKGGESWRRTNDAMGSALRLAVVSGMEFFPGDFARFSREFNSGYWIGDGERVYGIACNLDNRYHGGNPSAYQSYEEWRGRKPFIVLKSVNRHHHGSKKGGGPKVRLCVGETFDWHGLGDDLAGAVAELVAGSRTSLGEPYRVTVTSFADKPGEGKDPYVVACTYEPGVKDERGYTTGDRKVDRVFKITHEAIAAWHKAVRAVTRHRKSATAEGSTV
jgi:hypothetical protein